MITVSLLLLSGLASLASVVLLRMWMHDPLEVDDAHLRNVRSGLLLALLLVSSGALVAVLVLNGWGMGP